MNIKILNNLDSTSQFSYVSSNVSQGASTIPVRNTNAFQTNWAVQFGNTGEETAEIVVLAGSTIADPNIYLSGTAKYDHPQDTPIFNIHFDKLVLKRSITGTAGSAVAFTGSTISITPDSSYTEFNDTTGLDTYAYKTQYLCTATNDVSAESDWVVPGGPALYSLSGLRQRLKDNLVSANYVKEDRIIDTWINEWVESMTNSAIKVNQDFSLGTVGVTFGTTGLGTITSTDFKQPRKVEVNYAGGTTLALSQQIGINAFSQFDQFSSTDPRHYWLGDSIIGILPAQTGGTVNLTYSKMSTVLFEDVDELPVSLRSYTTGCVHWALYRAYDLDQKKEQAESHYGKFRAVQNDFVNDMTPRDVSGPKFIHFTDSLSGRNDDAAIDFYF